VVAVTANASLDEFATESDSDGQPNDDLSVLERLLEPTSPVLGLQLVPGCSDPVFLQNRGTERYLFRDDHGRWFIPLTDTEVIKHVGDVRNVRTRWEELFTQVELVAADLVAFIRSLNLIGASIDITIDCLVMGAFRSSA
jgi:hypothetical protein